MAKAITIRFRNGKDDDLLLALMDIPKYLDKSHVIREALRAYFFSTKSGQNQVSSYYNTHVSARESQPTKLEKAEVSKEELSENLDSTLGNY